jgi:4-amino-4-deoxy-L-arabinose transferase-like glycosyltransferase
MKPAVTVFPRPEKDDLFVPVVADAKRHERQHVLVRFLANNWVRLSGLVLLAFLIRLWMVRFNHRLDGDGIWNLTLGHNLVSRNLRDGLSAYWPPVYPLLCGISSLFFHDLEFAGRFVSIVAGSLLVIPVYFLALRLYSHKVALLAALLVVFYDQLIAASTRLMTEPTYVLLLSTAVAWGLSALLTGKARVFGLTGLALGTCYLVKPEALGYMGLMVLLTLSSGLFIQKAKTRAVLRNSMFLFAGFTLLAAPYVAYVHQRTGAWSISEKLSSNLATSEFDWRRLTPDGQMTKADILWGGATPDRNMMARNASVVPQVSASQTEGVRTKSDDSSRSAGRTIRRLVSVLVQSAKGLASEYWMLPTIIPPVFILLIALGLFRTRWSAEQPAMNLYIMLFVLATLLGYSFTVLQVRYLLPLIPLTLPWGANGIVQFRHWFVEAFERAPRLGKHVRKYSRLVTPLVILVIVLSMLPALVDFTKAPVQPRQVPNWIKANSDSPPVIMASGPWIAFVAGGKHLYLPDEEYPVVIDYARRKNVKYIVVEEDQISKTSRLRFLLDEQRTPPELALVYKYSQEREPKALVYQIIPAAVQPQP